MRPLVLTEEVKEQIAELVAYAERERYTFDEIMARPDMKLCKTNTETMHIDPEDLKEKDPDRERVPNDPRHSMVIPFGVGCTFTIEEQPLPLGWCRHLSICLFDSPGKYINVALGMAIAKLFGFQTPMKQWIIYMDQGAIHLTESMKIGGGKELPK